MTVLSTAGMPIVTFAALCFIAKLNGIREHYFPTFPITRWELYIKSPASPHGYNLTSVPAPFCLIYS